MTKARTLAVDHRVEEPVKVLAGDVRDEPREALRNKSGTKVSTVVRVKANG